MKILAISDLHGHLPSIETKSDILLIAGDICPSGKPNRQLYWLETNFKKWLSSIKIPVFAVAGNHDWPFFSDEFPELKKKVNAIGLKWTYLEDSGVDYKGLKIWGTPWQPKFFDWAFNLTEPELEEKFKLIPDNTDILISHGPPYGYGDYVIRDNEHAGSISLLNRIKNINLKLSVFGHIHCARGSWELANTKLANVTLVNENYEMVYKPFECEI